MLIFVAGGNPRITKVTGERIAEIVARYPQCRRVDSKPIETWFNNLSRGPDRVAARRVQILKAGNISFTIEVSDCRGYIYEIYESVTSRIRIEFLHADDITVLDGYSSHSYRDGTSMYLVYDYNVVDYKLEEEIDKYYNLLNKITYEETIRLGGSMVHHRGTDKHCAHWSKLEHGSAWVLLEGLKKQFDSSGIMNTGTIYPIEK